MKRFFLLSIVLVFAVIAAGCGSTGDDPMLPSNDLSLQVIDLDSPTGGFTETDEEPLFGEPDAFTLVEAGEGEDSKYDDPLQNTEEVCNMEERHGVRIYRFRALWGRMVNAAIDTLADDCCTVDWSGGMKLVGGVIVIERLLKFDACDEIVRTSPSSIRWKSMTCPHVDGIQVRLIVPPVPDPDSTTAQPDTPEEEIPVPTLTIVAGPYERTFTLEELEALELMEPVDECHNNMAIASHRILPGCPNGYLLGRWVKLEEPDTIYVEEPDSGSVEEPDSGTVEEPREIRGVVHGHFNGIWVSERGWAVGHVRGIYGTNSSDEYKFFGKYINPKGKFMGIIAGDYGTYETISADLLNEAGWFEGLWYGRHHGVMGRLKGEWITSDNKGYFKGIWDMLCNEKM